MKKLIVIVFMLNLNLICLQAQVNQEWAVYYDGSKSFDEPSGMLVDASGNIYVTGTSNGINYQDYLTIKYNNSGATQWIQRYNGPGNNDDVPEAIALDGSGNVYVTGGSTQSNSRMEFNTIKYSSSGVQLWLNTFGGTDISLGDYATSIAVYGSGIVYITGTTYNTGTSFDITTIKYNSLGTQQWVQNKNGPDNIDDMPSALVTDNAGNIYVTGYISNGFNNFYDYSTTKYNSNGDELWSQYYNGTFDGWDQGVAIAVDNTGNSYVTGASRGVGSDYDIVTIKYSPAGAPLWIKRYDGYFGWEAGNSILVDDSSNVYVSGGSAGVSTGNDFVTIKYNSVGGRIWVRRYNGPANGNDITYSMTKDSLNNIYVTGSSEGEGTMKDIVTIKYSSSGDELWNVRFNGSSNRDDVPVAVRLDRNNNVIVSGKSYSDSTENDYVTIKYSQTVGISTISNQVPVRTDLAQNYPNPFNPTTNLEFGISELGFVSLKIYNALGNEVATIVNERLAPGRYKYQFSAFNYQLSSGIYYYRLSATGGSGNFSEVRKMILLK
ncbi:MAG: SBBP repeat-containing protein [Ignavibacteriae bacterium]|nr:SBBP repeat-containing protein [Ignavibacteriota bacterium]